MMNKSVLKSFAVRTRQQLLQTAVSSGMNQTQAEEAAYSCFMYCTAKCYLEANALRYDPSDIMPSFRVHESLRPLSDTVMESIRNLICESDWKHHAQLIGWAHQYYHTEEKDAIFADKNHMQIAERDIPSATQFFTPEWLAEYMVQNTLGRLCRTPETVQRYYLPSVTQNQNRSPEKIRILDPCMGTGHILIYAFDMLLQIYLHEGYNAVTAVRWILSENLYGLELDRHACEAACFALLVKALAYDRNFLQSGIRPNFFFFQDEIAGSLLSESRNPEISGVLHQQYDIVVTNPPYMGSAGMPKTLSDYVRKAYPDSCQDLYSCFLERCSGLTREDGYLAMLTMHGWLFLTSFEKLRQKILNTHSMINLLHLGPYAFDTSDVGSIVQSACFVMRKQRPCHTEGMYFNLCDFRDTEQKRRAFLNRQTKPYRIAQEQFSRIPSSPVIYWSSEKIFQLFQAPKLGEFAEPKQGLTTSDNQRFIRLWHEVSYGNICFHAQNHEQARNSRKKWFPYHKGGGFRKWYGNHNEIINYEDNGKELTAFHEKLNRRHPGGRLKNRKYYFRESITWTFIALTPGFRYNPEGFLFDVAGSSLFTDSERERKYLLAFLCSAAARYLLYILNPTMNIQTRDIKLLPYLRNDSEQISELVQENITLCRKDWDSFETSWNFRQHPLI